MSFEGQLFLEALMSKLSTTNTSVAAAAERNAVEKRPWKQKNPDDKSAILAAHKKSLAKSEKGQLELSPLDFLVEVRSTQRPVTVDEEQQGGSVVAVKQSKSLDELKPIVLREMELPAVHSGRLLACRVLTDPVMLLGCSTLVEDVNKDLERITFYNCFVGNNKDNNPPPLKPGTIVFVKEPFLTSDGAKNGGGFICVQSPSEFLVVHPTDEGLLKKADALCWFQPEALTFGELKKRGNEALLKKKCYRESIEYYERALRLASSGDKEAAAKAAPLQRNMSQALFELGRFTESAEFAKRALENGGDRAKALYRLGKAAYGERRWAEAVERYQELLSIENCPWKEAAEQQLALSKARLRESTTGEYDMRALYQEAKRKGGCMEFDLADYTAPGVRVTDIPGKGKGLVIDRGAKRGTLLIASKAYALCWGSTVDGKQKNKGFKFSEQFREPLMKYEAKAHIVNRMEREPETVKDVYALYTGEERFDRDRGESVPEGVIDVHRVERVCSKNGFNVGGLDCLGAQGDSSVKAYGLWILPSFLNHSCLENTFRVYCGDMMFVHASRDLHAGEELTTTYAMHFSGLDERTKHLAGFGFRCDCPLCVLDRQDSPGVRARREDLDAKFMALNAQAGMFPSDARVRTALEAVVAEMRFLYSARAQELRSQLLHPLISLATVYSHSGHPERAAACYEEALRCAPLGYYTFMPTYEAIARLYIEGFHPPKTAEARRIAERAFQVVKATMGVRDRAFFLQLYPSFALYF